MQVRSRAQSRVLDLPEVAVAPERLSDRVYDAILLGICEHTLVAGERLRQEELAEALGVSRTPLREALLRLERAGLVRAVPRRGWVVAPLSLATIRQLYEARELLELHAVAGAAKRRTPETVARLERVFEDLVAAAERGLTEGFRAHRAFHRELVAAYDNDIVKAELEALYDRDVTLPMFALYARDREAVRAMAHEHGELVEAVRSGDPERARAATRRHIALSLARVESQSVFRVGPDGEGKEGDR